MKLIANSPCRTLASGLIALAVLSLTACALPDKPLRAAVYDFGPGALSPASAPVGTLPAVTLDEVPAPAALDSTAVWYRLLYADGQQLRPYAQARWSMTPAQLLRQRLREHLGRHRVVLNPGEGVLAGPGATRLLLRVELEEFSQVFEAPERSSALLRLRATALQAGPSGERLLGQRHLVLQRPAPSADAAGGVRALTAATDAALLELDLWLQTLP